MEYKEFPYNLQLGDTVRYWINVNYRRTGETKDFVICSQELLDNIRKYETKDNFHGMTIINRRR